MLVRFSLNSKTPKGLAIWGAMLVTGLLVLSGLILFFSLPDANAFNDRVAQIFAQNDAITTPEAIKLLEVMAQSGTAFSEVLQSYRFIIFVLLILASGLFLTALYFLVLNVTLAQKLEENAASGIVINSLVVNREEQVVLINNMSFELTEAIMETLAVLCEARLDDEILSGVEMESMISGKPSVECDEASGATRIKRLRDHLGNQVMSQLLIKNVSKKGYMLSIDKDAIKMI